MNVSVFGMGYVGCVTAACLLKQGHAVTGVDVVPEKIERLEKGSWPVHEPGMDDLVSADEMRRRFSVTSSADTALEQADVAIVCVGTPDLADGSVDLRYLRNVFEQITSYLSTSASTLTLLIRSTVPIGTSATFLATASSDVLNAMQYGFLPEFLREGNAISDFFNPGIKVIGCSDAFDIGLLDELFPDVAGEWIRTDLETAEAIKYLCNVWHAVKIVFTNEMASILRAHDVPSEEAFQIFAQDKRLNISSAYMRPGFAYGGSCLPKDLKATLNQARNKSISTPLLQSVDVSNGQLIDELIALVNRLGGSHIGVCGITFKPATDDLRYSPMIAVIRKLKERRASYSHERQVVVWDDEKALKRIPSELGGLISTSKDLRSLVRSSDVLILGPAALPDSLIRSALEGGTAVIDLKWHPVARDLAAFPSYHSLV